MSSFFEGHIWPMRGKLFRMAFLWVKDRQLAEDVLQNVFEKSIRNQEALHAHPNIGGWVVQCLKNEVLMHFRKQETFESLDESAEMALPELPENQEGQVSKLLGLVDCLSEKQRQVFQLREMEGLSYEEISDYLEISLDQVKVNLHRARKALRDEYKKTTDWKNEPSTR